MRLEFFHSRELGLHIRGVIKIGTAVSDFTSDDALELYLSLKALGAGRHFLKKKIAKQTLLIVRFVPNKDRRARRRIISEHAYVMKEQRPEPSRSLQISHMTTEVQPVT